MKIRNRITLWITGAGLLAASLFSVVVSYELAEQPFELVDRELDSHVYALFFGISPQNGVPILPSNTVMLDLLGKLYWFKVFDQQHNSIYASSMSEVGDIPLRENDKR